MSVADTVTELLSPVVASLDVELVDVEWVGSSLRIVVDEAGGITTARLAEINRTISPILDQHDPVPGRYTLEVSSPGVERKLTKPTHFTRAIGEDVIVKLEPGNEPRRIKGYLSGFDTETDTLTVDAVEIDGVDLPEVEVHQINAGDIAKARTVFAWGPTPKKGGKAGPKKANAHRPNASNPDGAASDAAPKAPAKKAKKPKVKQHPELDQPPISDTTNQSSTTSEASRHE